MSGHSPERLNATGRSLELSSSQQTLEKPEEDEVLNPRQKLARSEVRWGVLSMPPEWYQNHDHELLGFGTEADIVTAPVEGKWYQ
ncbi:hypothetical protein GGR57DRAFT_488414 [Xylariaceae sp. FL1272]|nr:hypothetical protein GGR57DRAFT_488414 [Xylariaceae sp. FL1272]